MIGMNDTVDTILVKHDNHILKFMYFYKGERNKAITYVDDLLVDTFDHIPYVGYKYKTNKDNEGYTTFNRTFELVSNKDSRSLMNSIIDVMVKKLSKKHNYPAVVTMDLYSITATGMIDIELNVPTEFEYVV